MKSLTLFLFAGLLFTIVGCEKTTPIAVTLTIENDTDYEIESFEMTISDKDGISQIVTFGAVAKTEKGDPEFVEGLAYASEQISNTQYYFGHEFKVVIDGVKYDLNYGICGTGLTYGDTEDGSFNTKISYLDLVEGYIGISQTKE